MSQLVKVKLKNSQKAENNKPSGEDRITGELIKYAPDIVKKKIM